MEEKEKPSYYAIIPADVRYCKDLPANAKLMYGEITCLANKEGYCWASNNYFAELYGVNKSTVSRWVAKLEKIGKIAVKLHYDTDGKTVIKRAIYLNESTTPCNTPIDNFAYTPIGKNAYTPIGKKSKDNSTRVNTTSKNITSNLTEVKNTSVVSDKTFPTLAPECSESKQLTPEEIKAEIWSNFGECYDMYPGTKLLKSNMFGCFRKGCKVNHLDELEESRKLVPALKEQIAHKQKLLSKGEFTPQWKTMSGWLANACWTEVLPVDPQEKAEEEKALRAGYQLSVAMGKTTLSYEEWLKPSQP